MISSRQRFYAAVVSALLAFFLLIIYEATDSYPTNDLYFPFCAATAMMDGVDPYGAACLIIAEGVVYPPNPLTTAMVVFPFAPLGYAGMIVVWSLFTGILTFGILRQGEWWRLLVFLSAPYAMALLTRQWSPLMLALMYLPNLLPLALVKPHTGLPIILTNLTWRRAIGCGLFVLFSLVIDPTWPLRWFSQTRTYDGYIPIIAFPISLLILLALIEWRKRENQFLMLMSMVPQRGIYDLLSLWWLVKTPKQAMLLNISSWLLYLASVQTNLIPNPFPMLSVLFVYLPLLCFLVYEPLKRMVQSRMHGGMAAPE